MWSGITGRKDSETWIAQEIVRPDRSVRDERGVGNKRSLSRPSVSALLEDTVQMHCKGLI